MDANQRLTAALAGRYEIEREIGAGGMGTVYLAQDLRHHRKVAIKVLRPELGASIGKERFRREIEVAANLTHPHILPVHDSGEADECLFYVMPYVGGESLRTRLERERHLSVHDAVQIALDVSGSLSYAHQQNVVHRDIKPENILLHAGHAMVTDFGVARAIVAARDARITESGISVGTPAYMSPEQAVGSVDIDGRSDTYSLGCVLHEMLTGELPARFHDAGSRTERVTLEATPVAGQLGAPVRAQLSRTLSKALAISPSLRFQSADEFSAALSELSMPPTKWRLRTRVLAGLGLTMLLVATVAGTLEHLRSRSSRAVAGEPVVSPLLTGEAIERQPAWSPAGNLIAYVSDEAGNDDIWISDPSGANRANLTKDHTGVDERPAWSPDGKRIAFYSVRDGPGIYEMSALGGAARKMVTVQPGVLYTFSLQWAADSSLVFTDFDRSGSKQVYRAAPPSWRRECLSCRTGKTEGQLGQLSPSGMLLVFKSQETGSRGELYLSDVRSGRTVSVGRNVDHPQWTAAGDGIYYVSDRDGAKDLWLLPVDQRGGVPGGEARRLTSALNVDDFAATAGNTVLIVRQRASATIWAFDIRRPPKADALAGRQLTKSDEFIDGRPRWVGASRDIVFESDRRGNNDIWRLAAGTGALTKLTSGPGGWLRPRPSPDGRWISVELLEKRGPALLLMRSDGSAVHPVSLPGAPVLADPCCIAWSPDGARLALSPRVGASRTLVLLTIDPETGTASDVHALQLPGADAEYPRWSPDGRFLSYEANVAGTWDVWVVNADGSGARDVAAGPANDRQSAWSHDGRMLYFTRDHESIWRVPLDPDAQPTGPAELWYRAPPRHTVGIDGLDISQDEALIALRREASDIWTVELPAGDRRRP